MNVLAVGAHPDDAELGCFGSLLDLRGRGHNVYALALAPGGYGKHAWEKIEKTWKAARDVLRKAPGKGEADYVLGKFPIGRLQHDWDAVGFVDGLVKEYGIDAMLTHHYGEAHQDHIAAQRIAVSAARRQVDRLWLWESSIYTHRNILPFRPQLYVPVSEAALEGKMAALQGYRKAGLLEAREVDAQRELAAYRGGEMRRPFAEAFELVWDVRD